MDINTSLKKLYSLHKFGIKLGLNNIIEFLNYLNNPQKELTTIHIAGSNGKGSTASFIASILQEYGCKVGLYTSPHFVKFNERIVLNGKQINDKYIASFISDNEKYIDKHQLTFFEVTTAMAFKYFKDMQPDYCVIETGLGGRLDATNVLNPLAVVITTISLEHTNILGNSIEQIAREKSAIIKDRSKVFVGLLNKEAEKVVEQKCDETKSQMFLLKNFIVDESNQFRLFISKNKSIEIKPPLNGKYQKYNASLAALSLSKTIPLLDSVHYLNGISNVLRNTGLQGRYEYFHTNPTIIFDSAHNPEAIENFLNEFVNEANSSRKRTLIFGAMRDKALKEMIEMLSNHFDMILVTTIKSERAAEVNELVDICRQMGVQCSILKEPVEYINNFKGNNQDECLVVLGSMYLLGEIKQQLLDGAA